MTQMGTYRIFPAAILSVGVSVWLSLCATSFAKVDGVPVSDPNPQRFSYSTLKSAILDSKCLSCHCADVTCEANLVLFSPYQNLIDGKLWLAPAAQSRVIRALTRTDKHRMPPPASSDALPADEIAAIAQWIDAGNPED